MDFSQRGVLIALQDLQRKYFGKVTMYVQVYAFEEDRFFLSSSIFDEKGNPHIFNFYEDTMKDENRKNEYLKILGILKTFD